VTEVGRHGQAGRLTAGGRHVLWRRRARDSGGRCRRLPVGACSWRTHMP
jgi:hypothetical protein